MKLYILEGKTPVICDDTTAWNQWFHTHNRSIAKTRVGDLEVSTVFLGLDHQWKKDGPKLLFETMIFDGERGTGEIRYSTWEQAIQGHNRVVEEILALGT